MASGIAALTHVLTPEALAAVNRRGDRLREQLGDLFAAHRIPLATRGVGSMIGIYGDDSVLEWLFLDALGRGFYFARRGMIALSLEVTDAHIESFLDGVTRWACESGAPSR
jgi:glutamate-1-semialdehyde 2,1-aminomutase